MSISLSDKAIRGAKIAVAILVVVILILITSQVRSCSQARQRAAEARVERGQAEAARKNTEDAIATHGNVSAAAAATERTGDENERTIRSAPGAGQPLDPRLNRAARSGMCKYAVNRNKPECRVQQPDPAGVERAGRGR